MKRLSQLDINAEAQILKKEILKQQNLAKEQADQITSSYENKIKLMMT